MPRRAYGGLGSARLRAERRQVANSEYRDSYGRFAGYGGGYARSGNARRRPAARRRNYGGGGGMVDRLGRRHRADGTIAPSGGGYARRRNRRQY